MRLPLTGDEAADRLLEDEPLALLIGMLLDQQVTMEKAFHSPYELKERLGGQLDAGKLAAMDSAEHGGASAADCDGPDTLAKVREYKRAAKAKAKAKAAK